MGENKTTYNLMSFTYGSHYVHFTYWLGVDEKFLNFGAS